MVSVEIITRLNAGVTAYRAPSDRGFVELCGLELVGLLAGLSEDAINYALAKHSDDDASYWKLVYATREWAAGVAYREGWDIERGRPTVYNMSALAVAESVMKRRCRTCKGRGHERGKVCRTCNGGTYGQFPDALIAHYAGLPETTYRRVWKKRYSFCYAHVQGHADEIWRCLNKNSSVTKISV